MSCRRSRALFSAAAATTLACFSDLTATLNSVSTDWEKMTGQLLELAALGVDDLVLVLSSAEAGEVTALADRFEREVIAPYRDQVAD
jgi:predicted mannosyl-3-phosphoglycerate phosphatase (HAD superfamily)